MQASLLTGERVSFATAGSWGSWASRPTALIPLVPRKRRRGGSAWEREAHPGVRHTYRLWGELYINWQAQQKDYPPVRLSVAQVRLVACERGPTGVKVDSRRELDRSGLCIH